jgi:predicted MPP superfamily phosphohydrolase
MFAGGLALAGVAAYLYASRVAARDYRLERVRVYLPDGLGKACRPMNGQGKQRLSILHLSDLHLCRGDDDKAAFLKTITDDEYDMVVITGDIFENESGFAYASSLLTRKPRLGAYAVLGNHDYYAYTLLNKTIGEVVKRWGTPSQMRSVDGHVAALETNGYRVLRNELVRLSGEKLAIIGIDFPTIEKAHLKRLVGETEPEEFLLALFHKPKNLAMLCEAGIRLALGGHTHGGQVRVPGVGAIVTRSELPGSEASGVIWRGDTAFHISRGLSADPRTNFRLFCPPAATVVEVITEA